MGESGRVFVGRKPELDVLVVGLEEVMSGRGRLVLIGGEAGIGKTRLADQFTGEAAARGALVLWGRCWEAGGAPAYWPWIQSMRGLFDNVAPESLRESVGERGPDLAQMLPEIRVYLPDLPDPPAGSPEAARFRLFDALAGFLTRIAQDRPLVLVLEDINAADDSSLLLLQFVAGQLANGKVMIIGTYRDVEVGPDHPLAPVLAELSRSPGTVRIRLSGLSEPDVSLFIESVTGEPPTSELAAAIRLQTEGNPFFVEEVVRLLASEGRLGYEATIPQMPIPSSVREVIGRRLRRLPEDCRGVLTLGAVIGREFSLDTLQRVTGREAEDLLDSLRDAVNARVIGEVQGEPGRFRFAHALVRETLDGDLMPVDRIRLHRQVGQALEMVHSSNPDSHVQELAFHFFEAAPGGDVRKAFDYAMAAGNRAIDLLAFEEAARLFQMAVTVLREFPDESLRCEALISLGEAQARSGATRTSQETFLEAAEIATRLDLPEMLARASLGYAGRFPWLRAGTDRHVIPLLRQALEALGDEDSVLRAVLLGRLAGALRDQPSIEPRASLARDAVSVARRVGDPGALFYALSAEWAACCLGPDGVARAKLLAEEINHLAEVVQDKERVSYGGWAQFIGLMTRGLIWEARAQHQLMDRTARQLGQPSQLWYANVIATILALSDGRFDEAEQLIDVAMDYGRLAQAWDADISRLFAMFVLRREQGRLDEIEDDVRRALGTHPGYRSLRCMLVATMCELGRLDEARALFDQLAADEFAGFPKDNEWLFALTLLAESADVFGDRDRAVVLYEQLLPYEELVALAASEVSAGPVSLTLGTLAARLGNYDRGQEHFEHALARSLQMQARPWAAHAQYRYAAMLAARARTEDREKVEELLAGALETAEQVGMIVLGNRIEGLWSDFGSRPRRRQTGSARAAQAKKGMDLTPRELEVARLVAEGMSNRRIAEEIYVSERTVETHVQNILMKLRVSSRTQVAAWVLLRGLSSDST